jgi:TetR/AcrR family transcriptional repressor of nem operon
MARPKAFDREAVLDKAMQVFWAKGFEATSVQDLVDATGINRGSLYATFTDKSALYLAALDRYCAQVLAPRLAVLDRDGPVKDAVRALFEQLVCDAVAHGDRRGCLISNAAVELCPEDAAVGGCVGANMQRIESRLQAALARAQAAGELPAERDCRALARFLVNSLHGLRVTAKTTDDPAALHQIIDVTLAALD